VAHVIHPSNFSSH